MPTFAKINVEKLWSKALRAPENSQYPKGFVNHDLDGFAASEDHV